MQLCGHCQFLTTSEAVVEVHGITYGGMTDVSQGMLGYLRRLMRACRVTSSDLRAYLGGHFPRYDP